MRAGILIIGSLLWGDEGERNEWRKSRLCMDHAEKVRTPIRYGRCSSSRGHTYTMTFTTDDPLGEGVLVPCKTPFSDANALIAEAEALWKAEDSNAAPGVIGASWGGCVGILFRAQAALNNLIQAWTKHFCEKKVSPIPPVSKDGLLVIPWPVKVSNGEESDVDLILATATKPDGKRPSPKNIADAWNNQNNGHERYFFQNIRHGIRTSEDGSIWKHIESGTAPWLNKFQSDYAEAVAKLRSENRSGD